MRLGRLGNLIEQYLNDLQCNGASQAHITTVDWRLRRFMRYLEEHGVSEVEEIDRSTVIRFLRDMEPHYADGTLAGWRSTQRAFWNWAREKGLASTNLGEKLPAYSFEPVVRTAALAENVLTLIARLGDFASHRDYHPRDVRDAFAVSLSIDCGGRRGEMWNITRAEMQRSLHTPMFINGVAVYSVVSRGKTGSCRLDYCQRTADLATRWLALLPDKARHVFVNLGSSKQLHENTFGKVFVRVCEWAGVPPIRSHAIRKLNITEILVASDVNVAMHYAGHRDQRTTLVHYRQTAYREVLAATASLAARRGTAASHGITHNEMMRLFGFEKRDEP